MIQMFSSLFWFSFFVHFMTINSYTFKSSIDNLLYVSHQSTLYAISSSHLYQLYWSNTNRTLLLLHRRVPLHPSLDETRQGVSIFIYHPSRHVLLVCARSNKGRCVLYDANDISRVYELDPTIETNYLGCVEGCYSFLTKHTIRSALSGYRLDRNGNIINSVIELDRDLIHFNVRYEYQSDDRTSMTSLMFQSDRRSIPEYLFGFDHDDYTYYVIKSSRLARLCQSSVLMHLTYEEIPLIPCSTKYQNNSMINKAFYSSDQLYLMYNDTLCRYVMDDVHRAFQRSKMECHQGHGYRLEYLIEKTDENRPQCQTLDERSLDNNRVYECHWESYRSNLYVDGLIAATGDLLYETLNENVKIKFAFIHDDILIIGTSAGHVNKFIRTISSTWHLLHTMTYTKNPLNPEYVIDYARKALIFAVGTELHRYAYNSCSLYDTCRTCIASQPYEHQICQWINGRCSSTKNSSALYYGCPPSIDHIHPINASVNVEQVTLNITGSFGNVPSNAIKILVTFPLPNHQNQYSCALEQVIQNSLTCSLMIPKQPMSGRISMHIQPGRSLSLGDTDIMGSVEFNEAFQVYIPEPRLIPDYGPSAGGTKIRVTNLMFNTDDHFFSSIQIFLGKQLCPIVRTDRQTSFIECINQGCSNDRERLELFIFFGGRPWLLEKTYFQCRANPILFDWSPKKATVSGGYQVWVTGQNLDVVQEPKMKLTSSSLNLTLISTCSALSTSRMSCLTPSLDRKEGINLPFLFNVSFIMDYAQLIPEESNFTLLSDPTYERFDESIQRIDATGLIHIRGSNLISSHSIDQINIHIDRVHNACLPLNLTDTDLICALSETAVQEFQHDQPYVEIHVGAHLIYPIGQITFNNGSQSVPLLVSTVPQTLGVWPIFILIILSLSSICTLFLSVLMITRRRFYQSSHYFGRTVLPPFYLQSIWNDFDQQYRIQRKQFILSDKIGEGCFVDVYQAEWKQNRKKSLTVAVKILRDRTISSMLEYLTEINGTKNFSHRNVLSLLGVTWDATREAMAIYPLMKNGDLRNFLSNQIHQPTMRQLLKWAIQVSDGMEYLSSLKFVHRDLAARNCHLDEEFVCRIADFSLTRDLLDRDYYNLPISMKDSDDQSTQNKTRRVPIRWLSPEAIEFAKYTTQSDIWSFGIVVWELFSRGKTPYSTIDNADIYKSIENGYRLPTPDYCPALLYDSIMSLCWHPDPYERPSFTQLSHDIRHILHQLEFDQQQLSSADDDTTIIQRYPVDQTIVQSIGSERQPMVIDENENVHGDLSRSSTDMFINTATLLPEYTETIIVETSQ